jgi:hypothetical protein
VHVAALHDLRYETHTAVMPSNFIAVRNIGLPSDAILTVVQLGDSVMRLNPVNGQGMTKVLITAVVLDALLRAPAAASALPSTFAADFFIAGHAKTHHVWNGNKVADYAYPACDVARGESRERGAWLRWYNCHVGHVLARGVSALVRAHAAALTRHRRTATSCAGSGRSATGSRPQRTCSHPAWSHLCCATHGSRSERRLSAAAGRGRVLDSVIGRDRWRPFIPCFIHLGATAAAQQ